MAQPNNLSKVANIANALFNSITSNATAITAISVGSSSNFGDSTGIYDAGGTGTQNNGGDGGGTSPTTSGGGAV